MGDALDAERRRHEEASKNGLPGHIHPYVAISRETGTGGAAVAQRVAELLNWEVLHREILDEMAEKYHMHRAMVGLADETASNWIVEIFGKWLDPRIVTHSEYIVHLGQLVLLAAQHSSKVFVGRGAQFFLPVRSRHVCLCRGAARHARGENPGNAQFSTRKRGDTFVTPTRAVAI